MTAEARTTYPTAFHFARRTGRTVDSGPGRRSFMLWLEHEAALTIADNLQGADKHWHRSLVGPIYQRFDVGGIGILPVQVDQRTRTWEPVPAELGETALIVPVRSCPNWHGAPLLDLIGWTCDGFYSRMGTTDVLGWAHLDPLGDGDPVKVHPDPGAWCRAGGAGVVVVNFDRARIALDHLPKLACDNLDLARRLDRALEPPPARKPMVLVPRTVEAVP